LQRVEERERAELERRAERYRHGAPMTPLEGRTVVIVDDGLATGSTARAAIQVARAHGARRVVLAVPVAPQDTIDDLAAVADDVVCVASPRPFTAIGQWYRDFRQTSDDEVSRLLSGASD
jgi:putative phosphoribosyl transferase